MPASIDIAEATVKLPRLVSRLEKDGSLAISKRGKTVAFLISRDRVEAMLETMEILANPKAMKAIRDCEAGKTRFEPVEVLDEDHG